MELKIQNESLDNFEDIKTEIIKDVQLLESKLSQYGSSAAKGKKRNCIFCSSSDGLQINEKDKEHIQGHCFSCNKSFDVINLVEEKEGLSFYKSVNLLAKEKGLTINRSSNFAISIDDYKGQKLAKEELKKQLQKEKEKQLEENNIDEAYRLDCMIDKIEDSKSKKLIYPYMDHEGKPTKVWNNLQAILEHNNIYCIYNEITKNVEIKGLPSEKLDDCIMDIHTLTHSYGIKMGIDFIGQSVNRIASQNSYNPIKDYLINCLNNWDGEEGRIKKLCDTIIPAEEFDVNLKDKLIVKWLLNTVKIPFNTGSSNTEGVLVLQGKQGLRKTTWVNKLVPAEIKQYLKTGLDLDPKDKDKIYQAIKYWIAELGELDSTMKSEQAKLKAFFTESMDELRRPYAKSPSAYPRMTSFIGTVNIKEFLKDETGTRRYWVVPCQKILIEELEKIDVCQLWGEILYLSQKGDIPHYLTEQDLIEMNESNKEFKVKGKNEIKIDTLFDWDVEESLWTFKSSSEIADTIGATGTSGIEEILSSKGVKQTRKTINGKKIRGYVIPPLKSDIENNQDWINIISEK